MSKHHRKAQQDRWARWLLSFQGQDVDYLSEIQLKKLRAQIKDFLNTSYPRWKFADTIHPLLMSKTDIKNLQSKLRSSLSLLIGEQGRVTLGDPQRMLLVRDSHRQIVRVPTPLPSGYSPAFWHCVAYLLEQLGPRLQRCPECKTIFVAKTMRKACCSDACSRRGRNRRWYEKHRSEIPEQRHQAYVRQVHRKHPGAKVNRRKPNRPNK